MLDFYLIRDDQPKTNPTKSQLVLIGRLNDDVFDDLQSKGIIDSRFYYYSTFRWDTSIIRQILQNIERRNLRVDSNVNQLLQLLEKATELQCGLLAVGD